MSTQVWTNGILREFWDDGPRTYTAWDQSGTQTTTRAYTTAENTAADSNAATATSASNAATLRARAATALNSNITWLGNAAPAYPLSVAAQQALVGQVNALTRQVDALIKFQINQLDTLNGA